MKKHLWRRRTKESYHGDMKHIMNQDRKKTLHDDLDDSNIDPIPFRG